ncbi:hypothetical protein M513_11176 [Trichuris suis]|uniref:Uncharacterized protein n=1 Tax=Trichuris suis TaxID=68888 RepID=A0A085LSJ7_9BILA|nr:hypothetical protein M513_11176 [Trichuris suis]
MDMNTWRPRVTVAFLSDYCILIGDSRQDVGEEKVRQAVQFLSKSAKYDMSGFQVPAALV